MIIHARVTDKCSRNPVTPNPSNHTSKRNKLMEKIVEPKPAFSQKYQQQQGGERGAKAQDLPYRDQARGRSSYRRRFRRRGMLGTGTANTGGVGEENQMLGGIGISPEPKPTCVSFPGRMSRLAVFARSSCVPACWVGMAGGEKLARLHSRGE